MRRISQNRCFLTMTVLIFVVPAFEASARSPKNASGGVLAKPVSSFNVESLPMIDAVLQLGQQEKVPLGIEYVTLEALQKPVTINLHPTTVGKALRAILPKGSGYTFREDHGVVVVSNKNVVPGKINLLDRILRDFSIPRCTLGEASNLLGMTLRRELHPEIGGTVGSYNPGDPHDLVGPLKIRNLAVRQVLNLLIGQHQNAAWVAQVPEGRLSEIPTQGLWTMLEYQTPPKRYAEYLRRSIFGWASGSPPRSG